jgi:hypothetical protein
MIGQLLNVEQLAEGLTGKPKYSEIICTSDSVHHKFHMTPPGIKPRTPLWGAGD